MRSSVNISRNYYEAIKDLPLENQAEIWTAIFEFTLNDIEIELSGVSMAVFKLIKPQLEISNIRSKAGAKQNQKRIKEESKANQKRIKTKSPNFKLKKEYDYLKSLLNQSANSYENTDPILLIHTLNYGTYFAISTKLQR